MLAARGYHCLIENSWAFMVICIKLVPCGLSPQPRLAIILDHRAREDFHIVEAGW